MPQKSTRQASRTHQRRGPSPEISKLGESGTRLAPAGLEGDGGAAGGHTSLALMVAVLVHLLTTTS